MQNRIKKTQIITRPIFLEIDHSKHIKQLDGMITNQRLAINEISKNLLKYIQKYPHKLSGFLIRDLMMNYKSAREDKFINANDLTDIQNIFKQVCDKYNIVSSTLKVREDIATIVAQSYTAIYKRHKKKKTKNTVYVTIGGKKYIKYTMSAPIIKSNKDMRTNKSLFIIDKNKKGQLQFTTEILEKQKVVIPITSVLNPKYSSMIGKEYSVKHGVVDKKRYGGFLRKRQSGQFLLTIVTRQQFIESYKPIDYIGLDINVRDGVYITFSDQTIIVRPKQLNDLCIKCTELNTNIKSKTNPLGINSRERTKIRKQWRNLQNTIKIEAAKLVPAILDKVKRGKLCLCIDGAKFGGSTGEWGQIISTLLKNECEKQGIPHIWVNSAYTSTTCIKCGCRDKDNRKLVDTFKCVDCKHTEDADLHAAKYIGKIGWETYK